jgi:hypothetical protein
VKIAAGTRANARVANCTIAPTMRFITVPAVLRVWFATVAVDWKLACGTIFARVATMNVVARLTSAQFASESDELLDIQNRFDIHSGNRQCAVVVTCDLLKRLWHATALRLSNQFWRKQFAV